MLKYLKKLTDFGFSLSDHWFAKFEVDLIYWILKLSIESQVMFKINSFDFMIVTGSDSRLTSNRRKATFKTNEIHLKYQEYKK